MDCVCASRRPRLARGRGKVRGVGGSCGRRFTKSPRDRARVPLEGFIVRSPTATSRFQCSVVAQYGSVRPADKKEGFLRFYACVATSADLFTASVCACPDHSYLNTRRPILTSLVQYFGSLELK